MSTNRLGAGLAIMVVAAGVGLAGLPAMAAPATGPTTGPTLGAVGDRSASSAVHAGRDPRALARATANRLIASRTPELLVGDDESFTIDQQFSAHGLHYVAYRRAYRGLPVVGGDFVIVTDREGHVLSMSVAQERRLAVDSLVATVSARSATATARRQLDRVDSASAPRRVIWQGASSHLAWAIRVTGVRKGDPSSLSVYVDARTGAVLDTIEHVVAGEGRGFHNGPNPLPIQTTPVTGGFAMKDPGIPGAVCQSYTDRRVLVSPVDVWGNGKGKSVRTGCVDAFYAVERGDEMLRDWLGRDGMTGTGRFIPVRVGMPEMNAFYTGTMVMIGWNSEREWISSLDVVMHEMGHGVDDKTPGGISQGNTSEFVADVFGTALEWYVDEPAPYDTPDFDIGESVDLLGTGPIRVMSDPRKAGDARCYSDKVPLREVHSAAGVGNHWFYLLAMGTNPSNGQPVSPTCNSSTVTGLGTQPALEILYHAMLQKTSTSSYLRYRTWTLRAAKSLYPGSCTEFDTVKAAWDAVSVPAQPSDPTCTVAGNSITVTDPGDQSSVVGVADSVQVVATDSAAGETLTYQAFGLPTGLSIDPTTGLVSGTPTQTGDLHVRVVVTDSTGAAGGTRFVWSVTAP